MNFYSGGSGLHYEEFDEEVWGHNIIEDFYDTDGFGGNVESCGIKVSWSLLVLLLRPRTSSPSLLLYQHLQLSTGKKIKTATTNSKQGPGRKQNSAASLKLYKNDIPLLSC